MAEKDEFDGSNLPGDYGLSATTPANSTSKQDKDKNEPKPLWNNETYKSDPLGLVALVGVKTYQNLPPLPTEQPINLKPMCECCLKNEGYRVVSSVFGALGFMICVECLKNNAEPLDNFFDSFDIFESIDFKKEVLDMKAFKDGAYIGFNDIVKAWKKRNKKVK
jgi:hypothetical protein